MPYGEQLLGGLVQLIAQDDPQRSETTLLAAALLTLGVAPATREYCVCTCEHLRGEMVWHVIWSLRDQSRDARYDTAQMAAAWSDGGWLLRHPQHPLAILRGGLTFARALAYTPRFSLAQLAQIETADTWLEAAARNLVILLRSLPVASAGARAIVRFGPQWVAGVPLCQPEAQKKRLLNYVEHPAKRPQILAA